MKQLIIIGASGHGKVVADIAEKMGYDPIGFLDDNGEVTSCNGCPVLGKTNGFSDFNCEFFVAIGNNVIRARIQKVLEDAGKQVATLIHPNAVVGKGVELGQGTVVMAGAVINPGAKIGKGCIINTCASVDHDCLLGDFVHLSVGAHMAGGCFVGDGSFIATGATVINNIRICADTVIGAGGVVIRNIEEPGTYVGCPVRKRMEK